MSRVIRVGTLFSGIETPISALQMLGIPFSHQFSCERDIYCREVIGAKFSPLELYDDVAKINASQLPDCDLIIAGPPCQSFSIAGKQLGFEDDRGNMFTHFARILDVKRPKCFIMENVRNLFAHDKGNTFKIMISHFHKSNYQIRFAVLKSSDYGIPQMRRRIFVVGYQNGDPDFDLMKFPPEKRPLRYGLDEVLGGDAERVVAHTLRVGGRGSGYSNRHNWDEYMVDDRIVRLNIGQVCMLQGLPKDFYDNMRIPQKEAFKQVGNAMTVDVIGAVISSLVVEGEPLGGHIMGSLTFTQLTPMLSLKSPIETTELQLVKASGEPQ